VTVTDSETAGAADTAMTSNLTGTPAVSGTAASNVIGTLTGATSSSAYTGGTLNLGANAAITLGVSSGTSKTDTLADIEATVNKGNYGVTASLNSAGTVLSFSSANSAQTFSVSSGVSNTAATGAITATTNVANQNTIGTLTVGSSAGVTAGSSVTAGDVISFNNGADSYTTATGNLTLTKIAAAISAENWGISAAVTTSGTGASETGILTFTSTSAASKGVNVSANTLTDAVAGGTYAVSSNAPAVSSSAYYTTGISGTVADTTTGGGTLNAGIVSNATGSGGVATTSYSDSAGTSLASTDLSTQADAQSALTLLNKAVTAVSAQDGYIGAQINQLNAVSSVLSTQQENVTSAQNAVQATDYASATSNMSKYEILSQTGISALAQANSMSQEVTKLLQ
jgi:flagellin